MLERKRLGPERGTGVLARLFDGAPRYARNHRSPDAAPELLLREPVRQPQPDRDRMLRDQSNDHEYDKPKLELDGRRVPQQRPQQARVLACALFV